MVEPLTQVLDRWMQTTREALRAGAKTEDLAAMLQYAADQETEAQAQLPPDCGPDTVHDEAPAGFIDIPSATLKYNLNRSTVHSWIRNGRLRTFGRLKAPATGGGYLLLREQDLVDYMSAPRSVGGRPRKAKETLAHC